MFVVSINPVRSWVIVSVCPTADIYQVSKCAALYFLQIRRNMLTVNTETACTNQDV
jgi:hypothetical protein